MTLFRESKNFYVITQLSRYFVPSFTFQREALALFVIKITFTLRWNNDQQRQRSFLNYNIELLCYFE